MKRKSPSVKLSALEVKMLAINLEVNVRLAAERGAVETAGRGDERNERNRALCEQILLKSRMQAESRLTM
jgi:hypothetical protein